MEIIETIPIYGPPSWPFILIGVGLVAAIIAAGLSHTEYIGPIIASLAGLMLIIGMIASVALKNAEFRHNEYIVRITDMPTQEFIEKYEVVKHFDYSDVIQVKEIEKK